MLSEVSEMSCDLCYTGVAGSPLLPGLWHKTLYSDGYCMKARVFVCGVYC